MKSKTLKKTVGLCPTPYKTVDSVHTCELLKKFNQNFYQNAITLRFSENNFIFNTKIPWQQPWDFIKSFTQFFSKNCGVLGQSPKVFSLLKLCNKVSLCIKLKVKRFAFYRDMTCFGCFFNK